jgi:tetratricopeptide (TPR) repeat protein
MKNVFVAKQSHNQLKHKCALALFFIGILSACSTTKLTIQSNPTKASIYVHPVSGGEAKLIGETPIEMTEDKIPDIAKHGPVIFEFKKEGRKSQSVLVTDIIGLNLSINREMEEDQYILGGPGKDAQSVQTAAYLLKINSAVDLLFEIQRQVRQGKFDDALVSLKDLRTENPNLAAVYEMEGGIHYLQKKFPEALDSYRLAIKFNPMNMDSVRMVALLEKALGISSGNSQATSALGATENSRAPTALPEKIEGGN